MKKITVLMIGYLYLPLLVFVVGWCGPWVSVPVTALTLLALFFFIRESHFQDGDKFLKAYQIGVAFLIIMAFLILCGHGDLFPQDLDWCKHHAIYRDLMNFDWPVVYEGEAIHNFDWASELEDVEPLANWDSFDPGDSMLTYYLGQYIVPALIGKLCFHSETVLKCAIVLWNTLGITLVYLYLVEHFRLKKASGRGLLLVFLLGFGGCLLIGNFLFHLPEIRLLPDFFKSMDFYGLRIHFSPTYDALRGSFQHVITPWISCCLFWENRDRFDGYLLFLLPLVFSAAFGAVYFTLFLFLYALVRMVQTRRPVEILKKLLGKCTWLLVPAALLICLYLLGNVLGEKPYDTGFDLTNMFAHPKFYLLFTLSEFGLYYLVLMKPYGKDPVFWITLAELLLMPFLRMGIYNDLCSRGSIPIRFFLMLYCFDQVHSAGFQKWRSVVVMAILSCNLFLTCYAFNNLYVISDPKGVSDDYKSLEGFPKNPYIAQDDAYNYYTFDCRDSLFWRLCVRK